MTLPPGKYSGIVKNPFQGESFSKLGTFRGLLELRSPAEKGFILSEYGRVAGAYARDSDESFRGDEALNYFRHHGRVLSGEEQEFESEYILRSYSEQEFQEALEFCMQHDLITTNETSSGPAVAAASHDDAGLRSILKQPGVIAVMAFFEGFAVKSFGDADFEQVAAIAEDFLRAGKRISTDLNMEGLTQILLESQNRKCIIAPYGDLNICLVTTAEANLGMLRLAINRIQTELK